MGTNPADRRRTTCDACDLPYYADAAECPYCATAGVTARGEATGERPDEGSPGLVSRLRGALGR